MKQSIGSGRGSVYNIIMKALQSGDKYGYQICQEVEEKTNGNYILKQPSLYSGLKRLEAQKYVESYWGDSEIGGRRHYYKLTEKGRNKIESTDFSWEDERNEIVDNFFKKSYIDENLDDVKNSIDNVSMQVKEIQNSNSTLDLMLKSQNTPNDTNKDNSNLVDIEQITINHLEDIQNNVRVNAEQNANNSSEIITDKNGNSLFNQSEEARLQQVKNSYAHRVDENQFDLFSFVQTPQTSITNGNEISPISTQDSNSEQSNSIDETIQTNAIETQNVSNDENNFKQESEIDFDQYFASKKNASFSENVEERTVSFENITFVPQKNDDFEKKYVEFQADINQQKQSFSQNSYNNQTNNESVQTNEVLQEKINNPTLTNNKETFLSDEELEAKLRLEQEKRMSEALSGGINSNMLFNNEKYVQDVENSFENKICGQVSTDSFQTVSQSQKNEQMAQDLSQQSSLQQVENFSLKNNSNQEYVASLEQNAHSNQMGQKDDINLNLKSIFGDVLDESESTLKNSTEQKQNYSDYNNTNFGIENLHNIDANDCVDDNNLTSSNNMGQDLPRYNMMDNVNLSLQVDNNQSNNDSSYKNFGESNYYNEDSSSYESNYNTDKNLHSKQHLYQNNFNPTERLPFDKKYARQVNNTNDFEIRYLRKNSIENKNSNVTRIAKLNMHTSWIILVLSLIVSSCLYFLIPTSFVSVTQKIFYLVDTCLMVTISLFYTVKYGISKRKNDEYIFEKSKFMGIIFICLISMIVVVLLNVVFGMNWQNLIKYSGSLILQVVNLFLIILSPVIKKILSKFSYYTK